MHDWRDKAPLSDSRRINWPVGLQLFECGGLVNGSKLQPVLRGHQDMVLVPTLHTHPDHQVSWHDSCNKCRCGRLHTVAHCHRLEVGKGGSKAGDWDKLLATHRPGIPASECCFNWTLSLCSCVSQGMKLSGKNQWFCLCLSEGTQSSTVPLSANIPGWCRMWCGSSIYQW